MKKNGYNESEKYEKMSGELHMKRKQTIPFPHPGFFKLLPPLGGTVSADCPCDHAGTACTHLLQLYGNQGLNHLQLSVHN